MAVWWARGPVVRASDSLSRCNGFAAAHQPRKWSCNSLRTKLLTLRHASGQLSQPSILGRWISTSLTAEVNYRTCVGAGAARGNWLHCADITRCNLVAMQFGANAKTMQFIPRGKLRLKSKTIIDVYFTWKLTRLTAFFSGVVTPVCCRAR